MLKLESVSAYYGNSAAIQDVNLNIGNGEFLSILGRNGVGKTSLLRAIIGLMDN